MSIIHGMSNADYHALPSVSSSQLKTILRSPAHYREAYLSGKEKKPPTADMVLGSLTHTLFLEPEQFAEEYVESVKFDMRTNAGKAAAATFAELSAGRTPVTAEQIQQAQNMANALRDSIAFNAMTGGYAEASIFFQDADTGLQCRIRPDYHVAPGDAWPDGLIIDVKSTDDARAEAFARTCVKFGYDLSAAMYSDGFMQEYGTQNPPIFLLLVVERDAPHGVACYEASEEMLGKGHEKYRKAINTLFACQESGEWPCYPDVIQKLDLPKWA
jgi:hypothetical protein